MMIPILESSSRTSKDSSTARVQPKPYLMPPLQFDDNDTTINNDNDTMALPSINIGGVEYGNDDGFTTPVIHHDHLIIHIRNLAVLPEFPALAMLPNNNNGRLSSSTSKHMTSLKPKIRRRSISTKEKRPLLARSA